ncbi:MAG: SIMPL domain-containing protein [Flavobacteriaceae bacterium]|nr:SIMPL domain-containing protein [Flavobacteriaceae bacterium]
MKTTFILFVFLISFSSIAQMTDTKPMISVVGESTLKVIPDYVIIKVRVEEIAKTAAEAKKRHDISVNTVIKFLRKMKIDSKDIATQYLNLNKVYDYSTKEYNFTANQSIDIVLKDLTKYENLIQGLLESGINRIDGIQFASTEIEKHQSNARKLAIQNAQLKALEYVGELRQTIGKAIHISEINVATYPVYNTKMMMNEAVTAFSGTETIAIGEIVIYGKVNVSFELK